MKRFLIICALFGFVLAGIGAVQAQEPLPDTPGAWIIYPDATPDHWVGNDRVANTWGNDNYCSIHAALGYSGSLISPDYQGPNDPDINRKIRYWEFYDPPPPGTIIELRGPGVWNVGGDGAQGGQGREKMKSLVMRQSGITIRGQDYDDGNGTMVQQEIYSPSGATTAIIYAEAADLTFENLHIEGEWPTNSGEYAIAILRYPITHSDALSWDYDLGEIVIGPVPVEPAPGLIVNGCTFTNLRAPFDQRPTLEDVTIVNNIVDNHRYNFFKYGAYFEGDNTITGNTFINPLQDKSVPYIHILDNTGTTCIDYNTFDGWKSGYYAIKVENDISTNPIGIGENNDFVDQVGGSGAAFTDYAMSDGSYAVGATSESDITGCAEAIEVTIDIKPGSDPNSINLKSKGVVPVAVLDTEDLNASDVDPGTVEFAGATPVRWTLENVAGDGYNDMLFHFNTQDLNLAQDSTEATLTGETYDETPIEGTDTVNIVPKGKGKGN